MLEENQCLTAVYVQWCFIYFPIIGSKIFDLVMALDCKLVTEMYSVDCHHRFVMREFHVLADSPLLEAGFFFTPGYVKAMLNFMHDVEFV